MCVYVDATTIAGTCAHIHTQTHLLISKRETAEDGAKAGGSTIFRAKDKICRGTPGSTDDIIIIANSAFYPSS